VDGGGAETDEGCGQVMSLRRYDCVWPDQQVCGLGSWAFLTCWSRLAVSLASSTGSLCSHHTLRSLAEPGGSTLLLRKGRKSPVGL
jgi:hypothetical protein